MNPHGLVMAYAEASVKPVVSDFDPFTIGSRAKEYTSLPQEQVQLAKWALDHTAAILKSPGLSSWNTRWLQVLREAAEDDFHPDVPEYGFGDSVSNNLIAAIVKATSDMGAVRHGAECFNYFFPQELDEHYLVLWEGFAEQFGKPWVYLNADDLPTFLLARIREGFIFPINPVWAVRDQGWYEVFHELLELPAGQAAYNTWFPSESGILSQLEAMHTEFPEGFQPSQEPRAGHDEEDDFDGPGQMLNRISEMADLESREKADLVLSLSRVRRRWRKATKTVGNLRRVSLELSKRAGDET